MYFTMDVFIHKNEINKLNISESLVSWGGDMHTYDPPRYTNNSKVVFEQFTDLRYYKKIIGNKYNLEDYLALALKSDNIAVLENKIYTQQEYLETDELMNFILSMFKLKTFVLIFTRDEEYIDSKYIINSEEDLAIIIEKCLNRCEPEGALIIKDFIGKCNLFKSR